VGWFNEQFICAILPDTLPSGAWHFAEDVCAIIAERAPRPIYAVYSYPSKWFDKDDEGNHDDPPASHRGGRETSRRGEVNDLVPTFLDGVSSQVDGKPAVRPLHQLLIRPLPWWKRALDLLGATVAIILLSPLMLLAAALIKITEPKGDIVFCQKRA